MFSMMMMNAYTHIESAKTDWNEWACEHLTLSALLACVAAPLLMLGLLFILTASMMLPISWVLGIL